MLSVILVPTFSALLIAALFFLLKSGKKKNPIILCQNYIYRALELISKNEINKKQVKKLDSIVNRAKLQCYFVAIEDALEINHATKLLKEARDITSSLSVAFPVIFDTEELKGYLDKVSAIIMKAAEFIEATMNIPLAPLSLKSKSALSKEQRAKDFLNELKNNVPMG